MHSGSNLVQPTCMGAGSGYGEQTPNVRTSRLKFCTAFLCGCGVWSQETSFLCLHTKLKCRLNFCCCVWAEGMFVQSGSGSSDATAAGPVGRGIGSITHRNLQPGYLGSWYHGSAAVVKGLLSKCLWCPGLKLKPD